MKNNLQIISGKYRGKKLIIPESGRPTQNIARLGIFNTLNSKFSFKDMSVWDAFAGSGAMAIEFISRFGAKTAIFTDIDDGAIKDIKENTKSILDCEIIIKQEFANPSAITHISSPIIVFIDPPYSKFDLGKELVQKLSKTLTAGSIIVWEIENGQETSYPEEFNMISDKTYGRAKFLILQK